MDVIQSGQHLLLVEGWSMPHKPESEAARVPALTLFGSGTLETTDSRALVGRL